MPRQRTLQVLEAQQASQQGSQQGSKQARNPVREGERAVVGSKMLDPVQVLLSEALSVFENDHDNSNNNSNKTKDAIVETWSRFILDSMTTPGRVYHSVGHAVSVARYLRENINNKSQQQQQQQEQQQELPQLPGQDVNLGRAALQQRRRIEALLILAALFHDVIYLTVDGAATLSEAQATLLQPAVQVVTDDDDDDGAGAVSRLCWTTPPPLGSRTTTTTRSSSSSSSSSPSSHKERLLTDLEVIAIVRDIFGYENEEKNSIPNDNDNSSNNKEDLSSSRIPAAPNEYLSAVAAALMMHQHPALLFSPRDWIVVVACIEASIPFRMGNPTLALSERLFTTLQKLKRHDDQKQQTTISDDDASAAAFEKISNSKDNDDHDHDDHHDVSLAVVVTETVQCALDFVIFGDLAVFAAAGDDGLSFLNSTWSLLPEWKPCLLTASSSSQSSSSTTTATPFSIWDWYETLVLLQGRYQTMPLQRIFPPSYQDYPSATQREALLQHTQRNLYLVSAYSTVRLVTVQLIVATILLCILRQQEQDEQQHSTLQNDDDDNNNSNDHENGTKGYDWKGRLQREWIEGRSTTNNSSDEESSSRTTTTRTTVAFLQAIDDAFSTTTTSGGDDHDNDNDTMSPQSLDEEKDRIVYNLLNQGRSQGYDWDPAQSKSAAFLFRLVVCESIKTSTREKSEKDATATTATVTTTAAVQRFLEMSIQGKDVLDSVAHGQGPPDTSKILDFMQTIPSAFVSILCSSSLLGQQPLSSLL